MVLKQGKGNINTGGTLRKLSGKHQHLYKKQAVVSKVLEVSTPAENAKLPGDVKRGYIFESRRDAIDDGHLESTGLEYSLNKKGRWKLAGLVKEKIAPSKQKGQMDREDENPENYNVTLLEHHKLRKQATCIGVHSTGLDKHSITPKGHAYFQEKSILNSGKTVSNKKKRRLRQQQQQQEQDEASKPEEVAKQPELFYRMYYPTPATSATSRSAKLTMDNEILFPEDVEHRLTSKSGNNKHTRTGKNGVHSSTLDDYWFDVHEMEDADEDCVEDFMSWAEEDIFPEQCSYQDSRGAVNSFGGYVVQAERNANAFTGSKKSTKRKRRYSSFSDNQNGKASHVILVETKPNIQPPKEAKNELVIIPPVSKPVKVYIKTADVDKETLVEKFGMRYAEAGCWPRRFAVDVSKDARQLLKEARLDTCPPNSNMDLSAFLVYQIHLDLENDDISEDLTSVSVRLESDLQDITTLELETLLEGATYTIDQTIRASCKYLTMLPQSCFRLHDKFPQISQLFKVDGKSDVVHQAVGCQLQAMLPRIAYQRLNKCASENEIIVDTSWTTVCGICYEECSTTGSIAAEVTMATALLPCQHWFCNICWMTHLKTQLMTTMSLVPCPEFNCESVVSPTMVLVFLGFRSYLQSLQTHQNITLSVSPSLFWCPNPQCGRVVLPKEASSQVVVKQRVACPCGELWCSQCRRESHWPATCEQALTYTEALKKNGDLNAKPTGFIPDVLVKVKRCPHCRQLVHKVGGCPFMMCVCKKAFCWNCTKPYNTTSWVHRCPAVEDKKQFSQLQNALIRHVEETPKKTKSRSRSYLRSVEHRKGRHPQVVGTLHRQAAVLAKLHKTPKVTEKQGDLPGSLKVKLATQRLGYEESFKLLMSATDVITQLHHVCEYTVVLLQSRRAGPIAHCLNKMERIAGQLQQILENGDKQDMKVAYGRFCQLMQEGRDAVQELAGFCPPTNH